MLSSSHSSRLFGASLIAAVQHRQHAVLAAHVVRSRRDRPQRRAAQDEFVPTEPQQIRQVRLAAAELPHAERPLRARQMRAQIRFEPARIEPFVGPLVDQLGGFEAHFRNSIRAIARLWTSSGPSTMRITRERAQA